MSRSFRLLFHGLFYVALALGVADAGCASLSSGAAGSAGCSAEGLQCPDSGVGSGGDGTISMPADASSDSEAGPATNNLCGTGCLPDDPTACAGFSGGGLDAATGDAAGDAMPGAAPDGSPNAEAGAMPDAAAMPPADASADGTSPDAGGGTPAPTQYACHLAQHGSAPAALCQAAGTGTEHAPCVDSGDCAPGFGCVLDGTAGECRHFCCAGNSVCGQPDAGLDGTFCAVRPLKDDTTTGSPQMAPVCVPADNCNLAQAYPCTATDRKNCTCPDAGTACMVVGDGLTSCVPPPGTGSAGDPCPCAWGNVCSQATGKCLKICSLTAVDPGCGSGKCQASKQMPDYFGVCVPSPTADGGL